MNEQAFSGLNIADFSWAGVGPIITRCLADHGATIVRVESMRHIDLLRTAPPFRDGIPGRNRGSLYTNYNLSKYSLALNLGCPRGIEVARRLVDWADVVVESFTPGTMKNWGLDYETVKSARSDIIMLSTCAHGQTGQYAGQRGLGIQLVSVAGFTYLTGWPDRLPTSPYGAYTDLLVPRLGLCALIAALEYRCKTGEGAYLDLSQVEASLHFLAPILLDYFVNGREAYRAGNRDPYAAPHGAYPCKGDDRWCVIAVFNDEEWQELCMELGSPEWARDPRFNTLAGRKENEQELDELLAKWTADFAPEEIMLCMQKAGVPAAVVQDARDVHNDPQLAQREHLWVFDHPEIGPHSHDAWAFHLSRTPGTPGRPAPLLGQDNEFVLRDLLGYSEKEYTDLLLTGILE